MLKNNVYDSVKVLHDMSKLAWFIKTHALSDAGHQSNDKCLAFYQELEKDLERHISMLQQTILK